MDLPLGAWYPVKTIAVFAAIAIVAMRRRREHHPFPRFGPANQITTVRALLVSSVAGLIGEPHLPIVATAAVGGSTMATLLDGVDGWVARRTGMASAFGARYDMEVDALLIQVLAILVWRHGQAGSWVLASGLLRYVYVAAGWFLPWMWRPLAPTLRARIVCVVQIVALIVALLPRVAPPASALIAAAGLLALGYSFLIDIVRLWRQA